MIARVWHGRTKPEHADAYESMLKPELNRPEIVRHLLPTRPLFVQVIR
jgi:hypothetical protein